MFSNQSHVPSANRFILHLLHLRPHHTLAVQALIAACGVMGISANNARVALARLCRAGLIVATQRGCYALAPEAVAQMVNPAALGLLRLDDTASALALAMLGQNAMPGSGVWHDHTPKIVWGGDYLMMYVAKPLLHRPWLMGVGFRQLEPSLFVRPNTLAWTLVWWEAHTKAHGQVGLGRVFLVTALDGKTAKNIQALYPLKRLEQGYRHCIKALEKGDEFLAGLLQHDSLLPTDKALRECYALLERCDVLVQEDPCLPAEWLDASLLQRCLELRCILYQKAQQLWARRLLAWA